MFYLKKFYWILFFGLALFFLFNNSLSYLDYDLGWHLRIGQNILNKNFPRIEYIDYTLQGLPWVDHEWAIDAFSFFLYNTHGYFLLTFFFAILMLALIAILVNFIKKYYKSRGLNDYLLFFLLGFGIFASSMSIGVRMQELGMLYLAILLWLIHDYSSSKKSRPLFFILLLMLFWANSHGSFLIGLALIFAWLAVKIIEKLLQKIVFFNFIDFSNIASNKKLLHYFYAAVLSSLTTLINPYGIKLYSFLFSYSNDYYLKTILEWLPFYAYPIIYKQLVYLAIGAISLYFVLYNAYKKKGSKLNLWQYSISFLFFFMSLKSKRHFPLFFVASFPFIFCFLKEYLMLENIKIKHRLSIFIINFFLISASVLTGVLLITSTNFTSQPFQNKLFCQNFPCGAVNFLKNSQYSDYKLFSNYGWGGFIIWTWPQKQLFIDGRLPQYQYGKHSLLEEYYSFFDEKTSKSQLAKHKIQAILLKKWDKPKLNFADKYFLNLNFSDSKNSLNNFLEMDENWKLVYNDSISEVYIKAN